MSNPQNSTSSADSNSNDRRGISKEYLYKYRWYVSLLNLLQPGLGFASHRKWVDTGFTTAAYIIGFYITFTSLASPDSDLSQVYIGLGLVTMSFLYSIIKPLMIIDPNKNKESTLRQHQKKNSRVKGGISKFWLLQFLNRLWPGLGLLLTRYWHIGLAIALLGVGMYIVPSILWPENQMWARKILFIITFATGFFVTLKVFGYGGEEKKRTWIIIAAVGILSLFNIRFTDMVRDNFVFTTIKDTSLTEFGLTMGDFVVSKSIGADYPIPEGHLVIYGDNNYRELATVIPFSSAIDRDSVFAITIKTLFPDSRPVGKRISKPVSQLTSSQSSPQLSIHD